MCSHKHFNRPPETPFELPFALSMKRWSADQGGHISPVLTQISTHSNILMAKLMQPFHRLISLLLKCEVGPLDAMLPRPKNRCCNGAHKVMLRLCCYYYWWYIPTSSITIQRGPFSQCPFCLMFLSDPMPPAFPACLILLECIFFLYLLAELKIALGTDLQPVIHALVWH